MKFKRYDATELQAGAIESFHTPISLLPPKREVVIKAIYETMSPHPTTDSQLMR